MRYMIGLLVLLVSFSAGAETYFERLGSAEGKVERLKFSDDSIAQNSAQRNSFIQLEGRPFEAECGGGYSITPVGLKNFGALLSAAWALHKPVELVILYEPGVQNSCVTQAVNVSD